MFLKPDMFSFSISLANVSSRRGSGKSVARRAACHKLPLPFAVAADVAAAAAAAAH